jgi:NAD+ diphosphatase
MPCSATAATCLHPRLWAFTANIMPFVHKHAPEAHPDAADLAVVLCSGRLLACSGTAPAIALPDCATASGLVSKSALPPLHLGLIDGRTCWLFSSSGADTQAPDGFGWLETRAGMGLFSPALAHAVACALGLDWWRSRTRFCGSCGAPTEESATERAMRCPKCGTLFYPTANPAVIVAVTRGDSLLLAHNHNFRPGLFSLIAGFVDPGETLEAAVVREVREEVGIEICNVRYVRSQPWPFPNSLMAGFCADYRSGELAPDGVEIESAGWFTKDNLPTIPNPGTVARKLIDGWARA